MMHHEHATCGLDDPELARAPRPAMAAIGYTPPDVSIIVVSYNTRDLTLTCLRSVFEQTHGVRFELIVVDNGSSDGSADAIAREFPQVTLLREQNLGFARANNRASRFAQGRWILLLNPDTEILEGAIQKLVAFGDAHPEAGIFGARTVFADMQLNRACAWGRPTLWSSVCFAIGLTVLGRLVPPLDPETMRGWDRDSEREVDIISGCLLLIRRPLWEELGGFDRDFFMYGEDFDLCLRARRLGWRCRFTPDARIIHHGGASEKVRPDQIVRHLKAKEALMRKHWKPLPAAIGFRLLRLRVLARAVGFGVLAALGPRWASHRESWGKAWARRDEWRALPRPPL